MMMSPESYVSQFEGRPYVELIAARESLLSDLHEQEAAFRSPATELCSVCCHSPGVAYAMNLEYLAVLCAYMAHHSQEFAGESDLHVLEDGGDEGDL